MRYPKFPIVPFHKNNNKVFKGNNAFLKLSHTHPTCYTFLIKRTLKNRYTRKQPTHFSTTPLRPKLKKKFFSKLANRTIWYA